MQKHENHVNAIVVAQYPVEIRQHGVDQPVKVTWDKCPIAWNAIPSSTTEDNSHWISMTHFSTMTHDWIPRNGTKFLILLLQSVKAAGSCIAMQLTTDCSRE
jgi:hypothetical protein